MVRGRPGEGYFYPAGSLDIQFDGAACKYGPIDDYEAEESQIFEFDLNGTN